MTIYQFKKGSFLSGDAQAVGEKLEQIRTTHGKITPDLVVDEARDEASEMHPYFTWDDSKAAHEYRLNEARHLTRNIVAVSYNADNTKDANYRPFTHLGKNIVETPGYYSTSETMATPSLRIHVLNKIRDVLMASYRKLELYRSYEELTPVLDAIDDFNQLVVEKATSQVS